MSELYMIVLQGREELGNDPEAIKLWSEISGVDIESITENTPFDIEIADKLLRTLPEVLEKLKEKKKFDVERIEKSLETLMKEKVQKVEKEGVLESLREELEKSIIFEELVEEKPVKGISVPEGVRFVLEFSGGKFSKIYGDWKDVSVLNPLLSQDLKSFHMGYTGNFTVYGERIGNKWIIIGVEGEKLGVVKVILSYLKKIL